MASWQEQYLAALELRDSREQANKAIYDACKMHPRPSATSDMLIIADTKLADHNASLTSESVATPVEVASESPPGRPPSSTSKAPKSASPAPSTAENVTLITLRADLSSAQATRVALAAEVESLNTTVSSLQSTLTSTSTTANGLARERAVLERKVRDRDEELREKDRMLERVQDDVVALEMQCNLLEQDRDNLRERLAG
jgi:predicted RNase H-like nuclease (RuvC/YqgF family)